MRLLALFLCLVLAPLAAGETRINFKNTQNATSAVTWHDWEFADRATSQSNLSGITGSPTGWNVVFTSAGDVGSPNNLSSTVPTGDAAWVESVPQAGDCWIIENKTADLEITGLDDGKTYTIEVYGARDSGCSPGSRTLHVEGTVPVLPVETLNVCGNTTEVLRHASVTPSSGLIRLKFYPPGGQFTYFSAMRVFEDVTGPPISLLRRRGR